MRLARVRTADGAVERGRYEDGVVTLDDGTAVERTTDGDAVLLPPCDPSAVYCVGRNYAATLDQMDYDRPDEPDWFIKPPVAVHPASAPVTSPAWTDELTYAGELAAVIGEPTRAIAPGDVDEAVEGYTVMNDLDALDQPGRTARKAFDGSAPLGPAVATDVDPRDVAMETRVGGELRQEARTSQMLFGIDEVVSYLSHHVTLHPGDVVAFGSPANPGLVEPGETVEITYEGVGTLRNEVVAADGD